MKSGEIVRDGRVQLAVWVEPGLKRAVKRLAVDRGVTMREMVEGWLYDALARGGIVMTQETVEHGGRD